MVETSGIARENKRDWISHATTVFISAEEVAAFTQFEPLRFSRLEDTI